MPKKRSWSDEQLKKAVKNSYSYRSVIIKLKLIPAGGNYRQVQTRIMDLALPVDHFMGKGWNIGLKFNPKPVVPLEQLLIKNSQVQSYKLKSKLFSAGLKQPKCEMCGWKEMSADGRLPVELDHINGDSRDNRIENLRVLCPNCHSLQETHRGKNKKVRLIMGG